MFHIELPLVLRGEGQGMCVCVCVCVGATINYVALVPGHMVRGEQASQVTVKGVWQRAHSLDPHLHHGPVPTVGSEMALMGGLRLWG